MAAVEKQHGHGATTGPRHPIILIFCETSESGVRIPVYIPADISGTKRPVFFGFKVMFSILYL